MASILAALGFPTNCFSFPSAIERKDLQQVQRQPYMVAEKTDGVRYLLAVTGTSACLIGRNMAQTDVSLTGGEIAGDMLLDGELVSMKRDPTSRLFIVYDALKTSRGHVAQMHLKERLEAMAADFFEKAPPESWSLALPNGRTVPVQRKGLVPFSDGQAYVRDVAPRLPYRSDGLIFTPVNEPIRFGTCATLFKWKLLETNTVDFLLSSDGDRYVLSLVDRGHEVVAGETRLDQGSMLKLLIDIDIRKGKRPIYECAWDPKSKSWQPKKARGDKVQPNSVMTFRATIKNLEEDIRLEDIFNV